MTRIKPFEVRLFDRRSGLMIKGTGANKQEAERMAQKLWNEKINGNRRRY